MVRSDPSSLQDVSRQLEEAEAFVRALRADAANGVTAPATASREDIERLRKIADQLVSALGTLDSTREAREAERRYRLLADNVSDVIWILDLETGAFRYVSPSVEKLRGFTVAEVMGQRTDQAISPGSLAHLERLLPARIAAFHAGERATYTDEVEQPVKGGGTVWTEASTRFLIDPDTGRIEVYGTTRDISERRKAEQALRERAEIGDQLAKIGASVPGVICSYRHHADGRVTMPFATPQIEDLYGLPRDLLVRDFSAVYANFDPDERARVIDRILASARDLSPWHDVFRYHHPSKGPRWIEGWSVPTALPDGGTLWHGFTTDVTERVTAEERVARLTRIHRTLSDTNEAIVHAATEEDLLRRVCDLTVHNLGVRLASVFAPDAEGRELRLRVGAGPALEKARRLVMPLDGEGPHPPSAAAFLRREVVVEPSFRTNRALGRWAQAALDVGFESAIALPLRQRGQVVAVFVICAAEPASFDPEIVHLLEGMAQDVSHGLDHLAQAAALRASEQRYRSLVENQDDIVYAMDPAGRITFISNAVARLGYAAQDLENKTFHINVHPQDRPALAAGFHEALAGRSTVVEHRVLDGTGKLRFLRGSMRPVIEGDRVTGIQGVLTDLTRQHEAEDQLRMAQKMEAIGRLAGGVAHDFNNLLLVIMSYTELAMEALHREDPIFADLDEVRKASLRAAGLTRQLLAFSRKQVMRTEVLDLHLLVSGLEKMLRRLLGEDVDLVFRPSGPLGRTRADAGQLEQVIMNLAVNARDAMPNGGTLTIETASVELDHDSASHILDASPGSYLRLTITDTGTGMDEATQARVFEPFFTTKEVGKGTGLGLAMVYGIVKQLGGCIAMRSALGEGTSFAIYLPVARSERAVEAAAGPSGSVRVRGTETILLVEDEEVVRKLGRRVLSAGGYTVLVARTGAEALQISAEHRAPIHILVTDVVMPGMNGRELADRLTGLRPEIKILYTSGYTDDAVALRGALDPGTHFLAKPYLGEDLLREIRGVLEPA